MKHNNLSIASFLLLATLVLPFASCGGSGHLSRLAANSKTHLQKLNNVHSLFVYKNGNKGPKDEAELKSFLETEDSIEKNIGYMNIERGDFEKIKVSERDNEPFVILYAQSYPPFTAPKPVVLEAKGVNGMHQVSLSDGEIKEVDDADFELMRAGKWKSDQPEGQQMGEAAAAAAAAAAASGADKKE